MEGYNLLISKEYYNVSVQKYEQIYFFLEGKDKDKCEIKLGDSNTYYKYTMKNLLGKKIKGYHRISEIVDKQYNDGRIKYRCKKCHCYAINKRIKHTNRCIKNTKKDPCYFYIFDKDEYGK